MNGRWTVGQFGDVVHRFRDRECDADTWDEVLVSFAILIEKGPVLAGPRVAKKLKGADGIWELIAKHDNVQPRLLFYIRPSSSVLAFVHAFIKSGGSKDYGRAIKLAKDRRRAIERGSAIAASIGFTRAN